MQSRSADSKIQLPEYVHESPVARYQAWGTFESTATHLASAGSSAMMLPPMALRPALVRTTRCPEEDAINGARTQGDATAIAAARPEPRSKLHAQRRYVCERDSIEHGQTAVVGVPVDSFYYFASQRRGGINTPKPSLCINAKTFSA